MFEIEYAAFGIREAQPAAIKLQWWAEELTRTAKGEARHPLTQALAARIEAAKIPSALWQQAIIAALAQRDPEPAANAAALLDGYAPMYAPIGTIEAALFGTDAESIARVLASMRALRDAAALSIALRDGKLPLPLDLLARHRLSRGDLAAASEARTQRAARMVSRIGGKPARAARPCCARCAPARRSCARRWPRPMPAAPRRRLVRASRWRR